MNLDGIDIFVKVVQAGSFTAAAKLLSMPVTTVSGKVAHLEKRLGVTLLRRTTRKLDVTQAGETFFRHCVKALAEVDAGEKELATSKTEPEGLLRLTSLVDVGHTILPTLVRSYLKAYPKMKIELILTHRLVDLVGEGVDLAIRAGPLKDSTMVTRKFLDSESGIWASAAYVKKHGAPVKPADLADHVCFRYSKLNDMVRLTKGTEKADVLLQSRVTADDMETLKNFVLHGDGLGLIPGFVCADEVKAGKIVRVLPGWGWGPTTLSFVYPAQKFVSPKVQTFIAWALAETARREADADPVRSSYSRHRSQTRKRV